MVRKSVIRETKQYTNVSSRIQYTIVALLTKQYTIVSSTVEIQVFEVAVDGYIDGAIGSRRLETGMARHCSICDREDVGRIDLQLVSGTSVATIARDFEIGESSVRRHATNHLKKSFLSDIRATDSMSSLDLVERLVEVMEDVSAVRSHALMSGDSNMVLKAATLNKSVIETILTRTGFTDLDQVQYEKQMWTFISAVVHVLDEHPRVAGAIAAKLRWLGDDESAEWMEDVERKGSAAPVSEEVS